jgi:hypothetical protein
LHIVAFDVPYPADYGGVIDVFYKIKSLHALGVKITLHCFEYGRAEAPELLQYCEQVYYYKRRKYRNPFMGNLPYIVSTRDDETLLENLCKDNAAILFEGLHTTYFIGHSALKERYKLIRNHNIEHEYYKNLEQVETNYFKKYFFRNEADHLKQYEAVIALANKVLAISPADHLYLNATYKNSVLIPAFHAQDQAQLPSGKGDFILYHGNLGVGENNHAALYLAKSVFPKLKMRCVIAGNNPSDDLKKACEAHSHIELHNDWSNEAIMQAIQAAQINVLPTFQGTGVKLKLLNALFNGRFCVVNPTMVKHTGLEDTCIICEQADDMVAAINQYFIQEFDANTIAQRLQVLANSPYNNQANAQKLLDLLT